MKFLVGLIMIVFAGQTSANEISAEGLNELMHFKPLQDCYSAFTQAPGPSVQKTGRLFIALKLNKNGEVLKIEKDSKKSTIHDNALSLCVFDALKNIEFPKEASGKEKVISATFDFPLKKREP